jgi:hypothetical protein
LFRDSVEYSILDLYQPVKGKTYSLFGNGVSTRVFYEKVASLVESILENEQLQEVQLMEVLRVLSRKARSLSGSVRPGRNREQSARILGQLHESLQVYMTDIEFHIRSAPFLKHITDRELFTNREQYYFYMIEFELVNRIHKNAFLEAPYKIALLPYCLRESQTRCKAEADQFDYRCKGCSKDCFIHHVSRLLREHGVEPYIWRNSRLKTMLKDLVREHGRVGVAGIACLVELIMGMRRVQTAGLPVVGIPLNANRCPRWMGDFHDTSVDLDALKSLLTSYQQYS